MTTQPTPDTADIVLATCNARYSHASLGLRCLLANLGGLRPRAALREYDLDPSPERIAGDLLAMEPRVVGLGVYIWNARRMQAVAEAVRARRPDAVIAMGGPELQYEAESHPASAAADYVVSGEGESAFRELCGAVLEGRRPAEKFIRAEREPFASLAPPDGEYTDRDLATRFTYVETTRGCPFGCEYCLSSRDRAVRALPVPDALAAVDRLLARGARLFKFVDRTFNLDTARAAELLDALRHRAAPGRVFHFEMVPDRFDDRVRGALRGFPAGTLRIEIGIQTFDEGVAGRVGRVIPAGAMDAAIRFLKRDTNAIVHADLIAGLPGEDLDSFGRGFDRLLSLAPDEIQVGLLKRLRGTPIARHDADFAMEWNAEPPYDLTGNRDLPPSDVIRLRRFAHLWEHMANRGRFDRSLPLLWEGGRSPFVSVLDWSDRLAAREGGRVHGIPLERLVMRLFDFLVAERGVDPRRAAARLRDDYSDGGRRRHPPLELRRWLA